MNNINKFIVGIALASASFVVMADGCKIRFNAKVGHHSDALNKLISAGLLPNQNTLCEKLNAANAEIYLSGTNSIISGKNIAVADLSLKDKNVELYSGDGQIATHMGSEVGSDSYRSEAVFNAVNTAVQGAQYETMINSLKENRQEARKYFRNN